MKTLLYFLLAPALLNAQSVTSSTVPIENRQRPDITQNIPRIEMNDVAHRSAGSFLALRTATAKTRASGWYEADTTDSRTPYEIKPEATAGQDAEPNGHSDFLPGNEVGIQNTFNVLSFGAKGDNVNDDTKAFQSAFDAAIAANGKVIIPAPPRSYRLTNTITIQSPTNQCWVHVDAWGRAGSIRYFGPSNRPVFRIIGLKGAVWTGMNVAIGDGLTQVQCFDIDTTPSAGSTSFVTFKDFYLDLGDQPNNDGFRLGHASGGGADISNYQWENCTVFGTGKPGQIAYHVEGNNTLSQTWMGGFVAHCDRAYSNKSGSGARNNRGNGSVYFFGMGCSHNNIDYDINFEQTYLISGGRYEVGNSFMTTGKGTYHAAITVESVQINDYDSDHLFDINTAASLIISNCRMNKRAGAFVDLVRLSSQSGAGSLIIDGGGTNARNLIRRESGVWRVYTRGLGKFSDANGVFIGGFYPDLNGK